MNQETKILSIIGLITLVIVIGGVFFLNKNNTAPTPQQSATNTPIDMSLLTTNSSHSKIYPEAKVTITEFADYQCPACGAYYPQIKQFLSEYEGKVNFYYRHFPLPMHPFAKTAARAAEAAGDQNKFWEMTDLIYTRQSEWSDSSPTEKFAEYAKELGLDQQKFSADMNSTKYDSRIDQDMNDAKSLNVNSTPTVYINDKKLEVAPTVQNLKKEIDPLLN